MTNIPPKNTERTTMAPINPRDLIYKLAIDSALQKHADMLKEVEFKTAEETKYVPLEMTVIDSKPGLPTFGADTITIEMPEKYLPGYTPNDN